MRYPAAKLESLARDFLEATGSSEDEARVVAEHMIGANLRGDDSHGVGMIAMYAQYINEGKLIPTPRSNVIKDTGPVLQLDGCRGYGQRIGREATDMAIERREEHDICMYTIRSQLPSRPHRHLRRAGCRRRHGLDPLRERQPLLSARRAVQRLQGPLRHKSHVRGDARHRRARSVHPGLRHVDRGDGQDPRRLSRRQEVRRTRGARRSTVIPPTTPHRCGRKARRVP